MKKQQHGTEAHNNFSTNELNIFEIDPAYAIYLLINITLMQLNFYENVITIYFTQTDLYCLFC